MTRTEIDMLRGHFDELLAASQSAHRNCAIVQERQMCVADEGSTEGNTRADRRRQDELRAASLVEVRAHERLCGFFEGVVAALATLDASGGARR